MVLVRSRPGALLVQNAISDPWLRCFATGFLHSFVGAFSQAGQASLTYSLESIHCHRTPRLRQSCGIYRTPPKICPARSSLLLDRCLGSAQERVVNERPILGLRTSNSCTHDHAVHLFWDRPLNRPNIWILCIFPAAELGAHPALTRR